MPPTEHRRRVYGLRRSPGSLPTGVEPIAADLMRPSQLRDLPRDIEYVVFCPAPKVAHGTPLEQTLKRYRETYVESLKYLLQGLSHRGCPVRRVVFVSSTSVYGEITGEWMDEDSEAKPSRPTGEILLEAEEVARKGPFPATIVRFSGIYGPGRTRFVDQIQSGAAKRPAVDGFTNRIHRDDCAGTLAHVLAMSAPAHLYVGTDPNPARLTEIQAWVAAQLGVNPPAVVDGTEAGVVPASGRVATDKRLRPTRLLESGYEFQYPSYRDGYAEILRERRLAQP